jgi:hypothetical protein
VSTCANGNAAEAAILKALIDRGFHVLVPFGEGQPYDLVIHIPSRAHFLRVQCKNAWRTPDGCLRFNCRTTDHGRGRQPYRGLADLFGVYFAATDTVYLVTVDELHGYDGRLRVDPPKNNQRRGVRFAVDYLVDRWTDEALADLATGRALLESASQPA